MGLEIHSANVVVFVADALSFVSYLETNKTFLCEHFLFNKKIVGESALCSAFVKLICTEHGCIVAVYISLHCSTCQ